MTEFPGTPTKEKQRDRGQTKSQQSGGHRNSCEFHSKLRAGSRKMQLSQNGQILSCLWFLD